MAKHEITIRENTGSTKEVAPYLGTYVSKETVKIDPISEAVAKLCGLPAIQVQTILSGAFELIAKMEKEDGAVRVNFDGFAVGQVIRGHFASSDAAFDPAVNALELAILLNEDVRNYLVNVTPTIVADEYATKVRVHNVADTVTPRPYQVIHGKHPFCVTGINLVMSDEGAEVYLEDSKGIKFECVVDEVKSRQEFVAHSAALLAGGDYRLWVKSRGGDAEGTLQSDFRKVKYLYVEPDPLAVSEDGDIKVMTLGTLSNKTPCTMTGTNVGYDDAAENGIYEVRAAIEDYGELAFKSSKGGGFDASEVTLTYDPESTSAEELPPPGTYDVLVAFERKGGSEGSEEIVSTRPVRVVID